MSVVAALAAAAAAWLCWRPRPRAGASARDPAPAWLGALACVVAGAGVVVVGPAVLAVVVVAWAGRSLVRTRARRREAAVTADRVLEACELLAADVAAGQPPSRSLTAAAAAWPALGPVARAVALGGDVPTALREVASRPGAAELRLVAAAWAVSHRTGAGLADALTRVAASLRADRATRRVVAGELASARATARLMAGLPLLVLLLGAGGARSPWGFLLGTTPGVLCLLAGLGLGATGLWWIERIADGVTG
ncbi:type II secretion system F family protein [Nocardioides coralli]|uniref:type II secretion system F family protein n=1 Tax=Nocardioides coralli TaxID=2872154 RepID=UPI001CA394D6|nr:type II secretion system F family protein [Nocardioides coralli]QZY29378.1 type II secretion system F family protein [Nocardioides coralli]